MNAPDPHHDTSISHGEVDSEGRLVSAEPALLTLHRHAGGRLGEALAIPQLAAAVRLARRLGIPVSRSVVVADEEADVELWVRAQPEGDRVRLAVSGWRERGPWAPARLGVAQDDFLRADADWRWETDAGLRLTRLSIDAGRQHGFDAVALLGEPLTALFALDAADSESLVEALARRQPLVAQPARLRTGGQPVTLSATVRRDATGQFGGFAGTARLAEARPETPAMPPLSEGFAASLDKALRRPLAQIIANADSITAGTDGPVQGDYAAYAADIAHAGRHLLGLVEDLVDLQAVERPDFRVAADPVDLADVARRAAGLLSVRAGEAGVLIERPAPDKVVLARGDFRRALQILVNLIGNAVRYAPRGSIVLVSATSDGQIARVSVTDEGKGIAARDQARVFEKFERVDPGEPGGNGLGLYIARRLARAMAGDLTVTSAPGEGARFTLSLPADPARDQDQH